MKKIMMLAAMLVLTVAAFAQNKELPDTRIKDIQTNKKISFNQTVEPGKVTLINFWATWCVPCKKEIKNVRKNLSQWHKEADFNYMTISIDEVRAEGLVRTYAKSQGWDFPYYIDSNSDLKRSLNFQTVPFTVIVDKDGNIAYTHQGYEEGAEVEVFNKIVELSKK